MVDTMAGDGLPTPAQMRTLYEASQAVWYARRMGEASRAIITGNIAMGVCVLGTVLVVMHSRWADWARSIADVGSEDTSEEVRS